MTMLPVLDAPLPVFIGLTVVGMGLAAFMIGQATALTWRPAWQAAAYCLPLGLADRFLGFALFDTMLLSFSGYLADTAVLIVISLVAFRLRLAQKMVAQYPWLYRRQGIFGWRSLGGKNPAIGPDLTPWQNAEKCGRVRMPSPPMGP